MIRMSQEAEPELPPPESAPVNVWAGDVVSLTVDDLTARPPRLVTTVVSGVLAVAAMGYLSYSHHTDADTYPMAVLFAIVAVSFFVGFIVARIIMRGRRRIVVERLHAMASVPARTYRQLATQLWLEALLSDRPPAIAFGQAWAERVPADGPRVVKVNTDLPHIQTPGDVCEVADVGTGRAVGKSERLHRLVQIALPLLMVILVAWMFMRGTGRPPLFVLAFYVPWIMFGVYRVCVRPFLGGALAEPGCVRTWFLNQTRPFTREDSCAVLLPTRAEAVQMWIVRTDGRTWSLAFTSVLDAPALEQIIGRWSWRGGAAARHVGDAFANNDPLPEPAGSGGVQGPQTR